MVIIRLMRLSRYDIHIYSMTIIIKKRSWIPDGLGGGGKHWRRKMKSWR